MNGDRAGRHEAQTWLVDMLSQPRNEFPTFPAALSFVMLLGPGDAATVLDERAARLREHLAGLDRELADELTGCRE